MAILDYFLCRRPKETPTPLQQPPAASPPPRQRLRGTPTAHHQPPPTISQPPPQQELLCELTPPPSTPYPFTTTSNRQLAPGALQISSPSSESNASPTLVQFPLTNTTSEEVLMQEINTDGNYHHSYANRSVVRARHSEWDHALQDAVISIAVQPSLMGYVSKGIALCGKEQLWDAMEAFDLAFMFSNHDPTTIEILLLIKAIALFNSSHHDEAIRRVQDLATVCQHSDTLVCSIVNSYLSVQLATIDFENGQYSEAADQLTAHISTVNNLFLHATFLAPRLKIFTVLFGWDLDSLWKIVSQRRCEAFLRADRVSEAAHSYRGMMCMIDEAAKPSFLEWSTVFKHEFTLCCVTKGDEAVTTGNHERAIELYSLAIGLGISCESLFAHRSEANLAQNLHAEALDDAEKVIELNALSYVGYELKYVALHQARRYTEAIEAFKTMLSKLDDASDPQIRKLRQQYVKPSQVDDTIQRAIHAHLENAPLRLFNTVTGRLCNRQAQINAFMQSSQYEKIMSSSMKHPRLQTEPIKKVVIKYFRWVMLSHRWESKEPLLHDIPDNAVYDLDPVGTVVKLQTFCKIARGAGYRWAWSDTCCIDQNNNVELQESVNSMFVWYRHSALTIVYLSDVLPSSNPGALANSAWNTRGWTVQEFLAPTVVLFYQADWTLYLDDRSPNHKKSIAIMQELEGSTGINARALVAFRPGMRGAREKLQWASGRVTTLQEDIAYSLFGIFRVHLPVIYGEKRQNALGRLLQEIIAHSGDISALYWIGKSSEFNSCLPADITSYKAPLCALPPLSEDDIKKSVSMLGDTVAMESASKLYTLLENLSAPRFANSRLQLPCIAFPVTEVTRKHDPHQKSCFTYDVKADGLRDLLITTEDKLIQFSPARPIRQTFMLIRPWNRDDLGVPDFTDDTRSLHESVSESPLDDLLHRHTGDDEPVNLSQSRDLRLIVRLGQPFETILLAQQRGGEYKRIASDHNIIAQVRDMASVHDMMNVKTLEIL